MAHEELQNSRCDNSNPNIISLRIFIQENLDCFYKKKIKDFTLKIKYM